MIAKDAFTDASKPFGAESDYVEYNTSVPENNQGQGFENLGGLKSFEIEFLLRRAPRRR
jgi:hypothetical protein